MLGSIVFKTPITNRFNPRLLQFRRPMPSLNVCVNLVDNLVAEFSQNPC